MKDEMDPFQNSSRLRQDLIRQVFRSLSGGKSLLDALIEIDDVSSMVSVLEGVIGYPQMPDNFKKLSSDLNEAAEKAIRGVQSRKVIFFGEIVKKYKDEAIDAVPLDLIDILWLLMDEDNLVPLIDLLPDETRERQIDNFLTIDLENIKSDIQKNAIAKYRKVYASSF